MHAPWRACCLGGCGARACCIRWRASKPLRQLDVYDGTDIGVRGAGVWCISGHVTALSLARAGYGTGVLWQTSTLAAGPVALGCSMDIGLATLGCSMDMH